MMNKQAATKITALYSRLSRDDELHGEQFHHEPEANVRELCKYAWFY